jgi:hypothetical protein
MPFQPFLWDDTNIAQPVLQRSQLLTKDMLIATFIKPISILGIDA